MPLFKLSRKAKADLKKIAVFTEREWGRTQRNTYLLQFDQSFHQLADNPAIGVSCDKIKIGFRQFPHGSHFIFYKSVLNEGVEIIRILHKNMLPSIHFRDT